MAEEKKIIRKAPKLKLLTEFERTQRRDVESEKKLLAVAAKCGWGPKSLLLFEGIVKTSGVTGEIAKVIR